MTVLKPTPCIMIDSINDILKYTDKPEYDVIMKNNDLNEALCQCKDAGYEPYVKFQAGTHFRFKTGIRNKKQEIQKPHQIQHQDTKPSQDNH